MDNTKKIRALILDDMKERHESFEKMWSPHVIMDHARSSEEFRKAFLENERYDVICFDHDLNEYTATGCYGGKSEITGLDVAMWMLQQDESKWPTYAYVHSWNPYGAITLANMLRNKIKYVDQMISTDMNLMSVLVLVKALCTQ